MLANLHPYTSIYDLLINIGINITANSQYESKLLQFGCEQVPKIA